MASTLHSQPLALEDKSLAHLLYGLMACFPLFLVPAALSLLINFYQPQHHPDSALAVHLRWQRWSLVGMFTIMLIGYLVSSQWLSTTLYVAAAVWFIGRVFKGWLSLIEGRNI
ncbi:hypothetical protein TUM4438_07740 [Shewanella sairae]|uniref:DUF4870 domain-containing protein n=1 Tax=Shewanella sairae TaxID=190310 RepID=A0ABQ4P3L0_9GAMM|nr:hypothetical protein [Shewanella sairae]MCL1128623.1 hypothetical protein [Shewanella sairae]GIU42046.1 hypothetical protein TUM4438_07740 [Shewanella sairae]